jgi:hypothetical protein
LTSDEKALPAALDAGEDIDAWDELGMTRLLHAVFRGDLEAVDLLLRAGANPNRSQRDDPTATPLWHAEDDFGLHEIAARLRTGGATTPASAGQVRLLLLLTPAIIFALVVAATWAFEQTVPDSTVRMLFLPLFPGFMAGLLLSGHGGNSVVGYSAAVAVNSVLYALLWFLGRGLLKRNS